jgi:hypothetical protein
MHGTNVKKIQAMFVERNIEALSCNHFFSVKVMNITYSDRMGVYVCSLSYPTCNALVPRYHLWPAPLYNIFQTLSNERRYFREKKEKLLNSKCVFWFPLQLLSETFLILRGTEEDMIKNVQCRHWQYPLFESDFKETWIFWTVFRKMLKYQISWKSVPVGAELFHAEGRTGRHDEANNRFSQFCERT